jgi:hypothetical protein
MMVDKTAALRRASSECIRSSGQSGGSTGARGGDEEADSEVFERMTRGARVVEVERMYHGDWRPQKKWNVIWSMTLSISKILFLSRNSLGITGTCTTAASLTVAGLFG